MEKILVAIDGNHGAWEALSHACSLGQRMNVQLNVLFVKPPGEKKLSPEKQELENQVKKRLLLHIEKAKAEGIEIKYFFTQGNYVEEVVNFTSENKITLLISEQATESVPSKRQGTSSLHSLKHRISCKMEVVAQKKHTTNSRG